MVGASSVQSFKTPTDSQLSIRLLPTDHENRQFLKSDWTGNWYHPGKPFTSLTILHDPSKYYYNFFQKTKVNGTAHENVRVDVLGPSQIIVVAPSPTKKTGRQVDSFVAETYHLIDGEGQDRIALSREDHGSKAPEFEAAYWHRVNGIGDSEIGDWSVDNYKPSG